MANPPFSEGAQDWRRDTYRDCLAHGDTTRMAHFYSNRSAWPSALYLVSHRVA